MFGFIKKLFGTAQERAVRRYAKVVAAINRFDEQFNALSDTELRAKTSEFKNRLQNGESLDQLLPESYAVVKNVCRRLCGTDVHVSGYNQKWDMIPYDVQLVGAIAMHHGTVAEMHTGEGKTLTAVLALYLNALTEKPVHLVTVNDYLVSRDSEWVGTILRWLGLKVGALTSTTHVHDRKAVYENDVVYGTASEFGFDYLRDNSMAMRKEDQVQRGFYYAIIDEADSILIDEARTPLIISGPVPESRQMYDTLQQGVEELVRRQRDLCSRLATEAKKMIDAIPVDGASKEQEELKKEALRKLWLVSKGTPQNKILKRVKEEPDLRAGIDKWDLYYYGDQNKEEKQQALAELFIIVDEKANEYELTDKGITAWGAVTEHVNGPGSPEDFVMLDLGHEYFIIDHDTSLDEEAKMQRKVAIREEDAKRKERAHNLRQMLRAHLLMEKDVDYMVHDGKVIIIDENTGRPQPGRRFSDGLHQAIEAKENVSIQQETQTYATITLQNFFRMYSKLAGMTGTAGTEAHELKQIYNIDVLEIPTHKKRQRKDAHDEIYMTEREKYNAILKDVREVHEQGRPILIGTESVDVSEKLSRIFKQNKLPHTVLNAKQHDKEAEIIAHAGTKGAITISTNMAGRGTDIKLEPGIADLGGLYVLGTTRHQSRRIDRQLRGRSARQGDPGSSKFYVSFEDALLRLFASPRLTAILQRFRPPEGEPISAAILNKSIETAQKRIEQRNYMIRKHTLEYDDVMNKQRQAIYGFRNEILRAERIEEIAYDVLDYACAASADRFFKSKSTDEGWDPEGYRQWLIYHFPVTFQEGYFDDDLKDKDELVKMAQEKILHTFKEKLSREEAKVESLKKSGLSIRNNPADEMLRQMMVRKLDQSWQEHLLAMDHLRADVSLRAVGNRDPLMEFKHEAFELFDHLSDALREEIAVNLFKFEVMVPTPQELQQIISQLHLERDRSFLAELEKAPKEVEKEIQEIEENEKQSPITSPPKMGRNEDCPCGSGKKYKKCCGQSKIIAFEQ